VSGAPERSRGQASVELVGAAGALLLAFLIGFQLLAAGYAAVMADHAAEAAALALANRKPAAKAAADAVPGWPSSELRVRSDRDSVAVTLLPPSPLRILRGRLAIRGEATLSTPAGEDGR
jgi:hypothetical protein